MQNFTNFHTDVREMNRSVIKIDWKDVERCCVMLEQK